MLGIIILNYNNYVETIECIECINKVSQIEKKYYIVDNCSKNESEKELKKVFSKDCNVKVISAEKNGGYASGNNLGIKEAYKDGCSHFLISNGDVIYHKGDIENMLNYLIANEDVGMVGPCVLNANGSIAKFMKINYTYKNLLYTFYPFEIFIKAGLLKKPAEMDDNYDYQLPKKFYGALCGCCLMLTKKAIELTGGMDENTFLYYEEDILWKKLEANNLYTAIVPSSKVVHLGGTSTSKSNRIKIISISSALYFLGKYCHEPKRILRKCRRWIKLTYWLKMILGQVSKEEYDYLKNYTMEMIKKI